MFLHTTRVMKCTYCARGHRQGRKGSHNGSHEITMLFAGRGSSLRIAPARKAPYYYYDNYYQSVRWPCNRPNSCNRKYAHTVQTTDSSGNGSTSCTRDLFASIKIEFYNGEEIKKTCVGRVFSAGRTTQITCVS
jgi:hypothetical protein